MNKKSEKFHVALSDMKAILDKYEQPFFLACGTLLGQVRNNDFIAWDDDIDIGVFRSDFNVNLKIIVALAGKFKPLRSLGELEKSHELCFIHENGVKIDIFLHYPMNGEKDYYYYSTFFGLCDAKKEGFCKWGVHIRGLKPVSFFGNTYLTPVNHEEYLTESYGDDWRTPKKFSYIEALNNNLYTNLIN
jgi:phosphorylcholine metabolism protein LicD